MEMSMGTGPIKKLYVSGRDFHSAHVFSHFPSIWKSNSNSCVRDSVAMNVSRYGKVKGPYLITSFT